MGVLSQRDTSKFIFFPVTWKEVHVEVIVTIIRQSLGRDEAYRDPGMSSVKVLEIEV